MAPKSRKRTKRVTKRARFSYSESCFYSESAVDRDGNEYLLAMFDPSDVRFIDGRWRIQDRADYKIKSVCGKYFALLEKINPQDKGAFVFYNARQIKTDEYGSYLDDAEQVVLKYTTLGRSYWAYGNTTELARDAMWRGIYRAHRNFINSAENQNKDREK